MRQKVLKVLLLCENVFDRSDEFFRKVLNAAGKIVAPGVTTEEIDALVGFHLISTSFHVLAFKVREMAFSEGAYPSPLNYK